LSVARSEDRNAGLRGDRVEITISDNGDGIPRDVLPNVFKPFSTTKGEQGTGLGLPITRRIAEAHGAEVRVENLSSGGARSVLLWPTAQQEG
jgi:signal transduction histidine kinase